MSPKTFSAVRGINNWDATLFKDFPLGKEGRVFPLR